MTPISPILRDNILVLAKEYATLRGLKLRSAGLGGQLFQSRGLKLRTVSRYVRGDPFFLNDLAHGRSGVTSWKYDEIIKYFVENWPEGSPMPVIREFET